MDRPESQQGQYLSLLKTNNIKNLIFDLDGTLIDSSAGVVEATNYALTSIGEKPRGADEIISFIGYPLEDMFNSFSENSYKQFWHYFQEKGIESIVSSTRPIGDADRIIKELNRRGYRLAIATTKMKVHVDKILIKLSWNECFVSFVGADDVNAVKPAPDAFIKAMELMGGNISNSLAVGDTVNDVLAAKSAGIPVIAVKSVFGRFSELQNSQPNIILKRLDDILSILK
jgi:pyrophosphatase PpaX